MPVSADDDPPQDQGIVFPNMRFIVALAPPTLHVIGELREITDWWLFPAIMKSIRLPRSWQNL